MSQLIAGKDRVSCPQTSAQGSPTSRRRPADLDVLLQPKARLAKLDPQASCSGEPQSSTVEEDSSDAQCRSDNSNLLK